MAYAVANPDSEVHFLVAKIDNRVIGTISFGPCGSDIKKCTNNELDAIGELGSLCVLPDFQGKGVGSALIHAMIKYLAELGVRYFCLDSGYQQAQRKWLRKFGEPYRIAKDYWGKGLDHMVWLYRVVDRQVTPQLHDGIGSNCPDAHIGCGTHQGFVSRLRDYL